MKRNKKRRFWILLSLIGIGCVIGLQLYKRINTSTSQTIGEVIDSLNGVPVYFNGGVDHVSGRTVSADGYNIGLNYQCVEFVKRYYYEYYHHKMPDSYGHAKSFFDPSIPDGKVNQQRNLIQYTNGSFSVPKIGDLIVFKGNIGNPYGHVAIISNVKEKEIEIIQQNPGPHTSSRVRYKLVEKDGQYRIKNKRILGWLRMIDSE